MEKKEYFPNGLLFEIRKNASAVDEAVKNALIEKGNAELNKADPDMSKSIVANADPKLIEQLLANR